LKVSGLKATAPRLKILEIFQKHSAEPDSGRHMSAEDVYRALVAEHVDVGLATVYRVLTQVRAGGSAGAAPLRGGASGVRAERGPAS